MSSADMRQMNLDRSVSVKSATRGLFGALAVLLLTDPSGAAPLPRVESRH